MIRASWYYWCPCYLILRPLLDSALRRVHEQESKGCAPRREQVKMRLFTSRAERRWRAMEQKLTGLEAQEQTGQVACAEGAETFSAA